MGFKLYENETARESHLLPAPRWIGSEEERLKSCQFSSVGRFFSFSFLFILETCRNNTNPWIKRLRSGACYECSCNGENIGCEQVWCTPCPGVKKNITGKCCPQCTPSE